MDTDLNKLTTMNPKEKAKDLVRDMEFEIPYIHDPTEPQANNIAKQCALIAVYEILEIDCCDMSEENFNKHIEYWTAVTKEIELL
jgi:hypothetical protein